MMWGLYASKANTPWVSARWVASLDRHLPVRRDFRGGARSETVRVWLLSNAEQTEGEFHDKKYISLALVGWNSWSWTTSSSSLAYRLCICLGFQSWLEAGGWIYVEKPRLGSLYLHVLCEMFYNRLLCTQTTFPVTDQRFTLFISWISMLHPTTPPTAFCRRRCETHIWHIVYHPERCHAMLQQASNPLMLNFWSLFHLPYVKFS